MNRRVFISHASEDKGSLVRELATVLISKGIDVWYDEYEIKPGCSIRESIDRGLSSCDIGLVVFSNYYFSKSWTIWELNGFIQKLLSSSGKLIPVYFNITHKELLKISPSLADIMGLIYNGDINALSEDILNVLYPNKPILLSVRDILASYQMSPPDFYDNWWLDRIEFSGNNDTSFIPWSFPNNPVVEKSSTLRPYSLAWACMRYSWISNAHKQKLNQFTHPEKVIEFISSNPGLYEACKSNIAYLALYAPQLLFFESEFLELFREKYEQSVKGLSSVCVDDNFRCSLTPDGTIPKCNRLYALMDSNLGGYSNLSLLRHFIEGEQLGPAPSNIDYWLGLIYLCSSESEIYPANVRNALISAYANQYSANQLKKVFINKEPVYLEEIFSSVKHIEQVIEEILGDRNINIHSSIRIVSERIRLLHLTADLFLDKSYRLTIPSDEQKYGFRGITDQRFENKP